MGARFLVPGRLPALDAVDQLQDHLEVVGIEMVEGGIEMGARRCTPASWHKAGVVRQLAGRCLSPHLCSAHGARPGLRVRADRLNHGDGFG